MVSYRTQDMDNERWENLKESHKKEVKIINLNDSAQKYRNRNRNKYL